MGSVGKAISSPFSSLFSGLGSPGAGGKGGFFDPSYQQQTQSSNSGLLPADRALISARSPGQLQQLWDQGQSAYGAPAGLPELTANGLYAPQENAFASAIQQANSQFSGTAAGRGQLSPMNIGSIAGSAVQNVLPQFAPLIGQNVTNALNMPEQIRQQRFAQLLALTGQYSGFLGNTSQGQSTGTGAGLGYSLANTFAGGAGAAAKGGASGPSA